MPICTIFSLLMLHHVTLREYFVAQGRSCSVQMAQNRLRVLLWLPTRCRSSACSAHPNFNASTQGSTTEMQQVKLANAMLGEAGSTCRSILPLPRPGPCRLSRKRPDLVSAIAISVAVSYGRGGFIRRGESQVSYQSIQRAALTPGSQWINAN